MSKIILQDIDNVTYPFKEKHIEFLTERKLITYELADKAIKSKKPYIIDYLLWEENNGNCTKKATNTLREKYGEKAKEIKQKLKDRKASIYEQEEALETEALVFSTFDEFRESEIFLTGRVDEIADLNKKIKKEHPEIKIIGITARGTHAKKYPEELKKITDKTFEWNKNREICLDEIYFEKNKIKSYNEIITKHKEHEVLCFVEDDPKNIEPFLKRGIKCILIEFEHHEQELLVKRLKETYENLIIAKTPKDAKEEIEKIIKKSY